MSANEVIRIQTFLGERVDLKDFCFILRNEFDNSQYAYVALEGSTPMQKSQSLVTLADKRGEFGEVVLLLVGYWLDRVKGKKRILLQYDVPQALFAYYEELQQDEDFEKAAEVQAAYQRIKPDFPATGLVTRPDAGQLPTGQDTAAPLSTEDAPQVFLSYSRQDSAKMERVYEALTKQGISVWIDRVGIELGSPSWKIAIETAIDQAQCLVVLLSPGAKQSKWVRAELDYAGVQGKPIFPVLVDGDESSAVPFEFATAQWVDLRNVADYTILMGELARTITKSL